MISFSGVGNSKTLTSMVYDIFLLNVSTATSGIYGGSLLIITGSSIAIDINQD